VSEVVKFAVVGLGGYGKSHLGSAAEIESDGLGVLDAVVCVDPENHADTLAEFKQKGVRVFGTLDALIEAGGVDVITLPIGIHDHVRLSARCMEAGYNVLVEKPLCGAVQDANALIDVRDRTGKTILIGYQHLYSQTIIGLKERILDGRLGKIKMARLKASWPRGDHYYSRNPWAGTRKRDGVWTLDSPINNALAHYLTNIFHLASDTDGDPCGIASVQAELYRAWDIENLDTASLRVQTDTGATAVIAMSHVADFEPDGSQFGPVMDLECENGTANWETGRTEITYANGETEVVDDGDNPAQMRTGPWRNMVGALNSGEKIIATLEMGRSQTLCINGAHESCPDVHDYPADQVQTVTKDGHKFLIVDGLLELLHKSADEGKLFSELGVEWARGGDIYAMEGYVHFPANER
jgi:predicted dehydrogenase